MFVNQRPSYRKTNLYLISFNIITYLITSVSMISGNPALAQKDIDLEHQQPTTPTLPSQPTPNTIPDTFVPPNLTPPEGYAPLPFTQSPDNQFNVYRLNSGDGITISVPLFPEFAANGLIDAEGNIVMPILGRVSLTGLTLDEAEAKISYELGRKYLQKSPEVIVTLATPRPVELNILGEIAKPGYYSFAPNTPLLSVLQSTGGSTDFADLRSVIVKRTLVDGSVIEKTVDLYTPLQTGEKIPTINLQGGDTIIISRLEVGQDQDYDRNLVSRTSLAQPIIAVRVIFPAGTGTSLSNLSLPNGSTFLDVIASLPSGNQSLVKLNEVALMRFDPEKGGIVTQTLDVRETIKQGNFAYNIPLRDKDVIVVSRTLIGKVFNSLNIVTQPIRDFMSFFFFFDSLGNLFNTNSN